MDRKTQIANRSKSDGQARSTNEVFIETAYIDENFKIESHEVARGETGLLPIFSLVSTNADDPIFRGRLDDGAPQRRKHPELDIDIDGVSNGVKSDFKSQRNQYVGHHTVEDNKPDRRTFLVDIKIPGRRIFSGKISISLTFLMGVSEEGLATDRIDADVTQASDPE